jgi:hypothetical protein
MSLLTSSVVRKGCQHKQKTLGVAEQSVVEGTAFLRGAVADDEMRP